jgi:hypothetical protein
MPRLSCWFVRASLVYLALGFTFGALMLANKGLGFYPTIWLVLPVHMETLLMGWFVQLALGMAFWILPRFKNGVARGNEALSWLAFVLLNLGIGLVFANAVFSLQTLVLLGRVCELGGIVVFVIGAWRRVRPFDS